MLSLFNDGLKQNKPSKSVTFDELVDLIKFNKNKDIIQQIRYLKSNGDVSHKKIKESMPNVTPNCLVSHKKLSDDVFENNFKSFSGYIYFDFDTSIPNYKEYFISKYGKDVALVSKSIGGGGISVMVKVDIEITKENFKDVWYHIRNSIFKEEPADNSCCNIGRCWLIPYDDNLYVNKNNILHLELIKIKHFEKNAIQGKIPSSISYNINTYILNCTYVTKDIKEVRSKLILQSNVNVNNHILDFNPEYVCKIFIPKNIPNGKKRITYRNIIHNLVYLNPDVEPIYIFSFLNFVNRFHARPSREYHKLIEFFEFIYKSIMITGEVKPFLKLKKVHFNKNCNYTRSQKCSIANKINGLYRRKTKLDMIDVAIIELESQGLKVTTKSLSNLTGIKLRSVQLLIKNGPIDFEEELRKINNR